MTTEQLLMPRFKVIADYPGSVFPIGHILSPLSFEITEVWVKAFGNYPHLFRRLNWWEERELSDMPDYVKDDDGAYKVMNEWFNIDKSYCCSAHTFRDNKFYAASVKPATLDEYTQYINQQKEV